MVGRALAVSWVQATHALAVLTTLAVACTADAPAVPDGFTTVARPGFLLAYPAEWEVLEDEPQRVRVSGAPGEAGLRPAATATLDTAFTGGDFDTYVSGFAALSGVTQPGREVIAESDIAVAGAEHARLLEVTWTAELDGDADGVAMRQWDLLSVDSSDQLVYLSVNAPAADFDEPLLRGILDAFARTG